MTVLWIALIDLESILSGWLLLVAAAAKLRSLDEAVEIVEGQPELTRSRTADKLLIASGPSNWKEADANAMAWTGVAVLWPCTPSCTPHW